ncbi:hypothetical protein JNJ66_00775 [Candidatus Saccharibacteria bacterium]|nr:hypothetical protein [Candidatus Saccharibacteria bacterium]
MPAPRRKANFFETVEGARIEEILRSLDSDINFSTPATYSADGEHYPDHLIPFVDKHLNYLKTHPTTDPEQYIANLRLKTRVRR